MAHILELFTAGCPLCESFQADVELGKCGPCKLKLIDVRKPSAKGLLSRYRVSVVPTLVIDGKIKVEGPIGQPWVCGDEFYEMLERRYPLVKPLKAPRRGER